MCLRVLHWQDMSELADPRKPHWIIEPAVVLGGMPYGVFGAKLATSACQMPHRFKEICVSFVGRGDRSPAIAAPPYFESDRADNPLDRPTAVRQRCWLPLGARSKGRTLVPSNAANPTLSFVR